MQGLGGRAVTHTLRSSPGRFAPPDGHAAVCSQAVGSVTDAIFGQPKLAS